MKQLEWIQNRHRQDIDMTAQVTDTLEVWIGGVGTGLGWCLSAEADGEGIVSGIGEAKDRAETFAREWIASQAAALSPGEWTSALPTVNGWYWVNTGTVVGIETVRPRLEFLTTVTALDYWGKRFRRWSVPVEPPPLPEATDAK